MNNKRGLSSVVSVVLIILIGVSAIAAIWIIVSSLLNSSGEAVQGGTICIGNKVTLMSCKRVNTNGELGYTLSYRTDFNEQEIKSMNSSQVSLFYPDGSGENVEGVGELEGGETRSVSIKSEAEAKTASMSYVLLTLDGKKRACNSAPINCNNLPTEVQFNPPAPRPYFTEKDKKFSHVSSAPAFFTPTNNLLVHYKFEGDYKDSSGNGYDMQASNSEFVKIVTENGRQFVNFTTPDAGNGYLNFVNPSNNAKFNDLKEFTISVWSRSNIAPTIEGNGQIIFSKHRLNGEGSFYLSTYLGVYSALSIRGMVINSSGPGGGDRYGRNDAYSENFDYRDNKWHNYIFEYNGSYIKIYIDNEYSGGLPFFGPVRNSPYEVRIGFTDNGASGWEYRGDLDEIMFYNRALSDDEINDLYYSQTPLFYP